jgi:hypothetical protein
MALFHVSLHWTQHVRNCQLEQEEGTDCVWLLCVCFQESVCSFENILKTFFGECEACVNKKRRCELKSVSSR